MMTHRGPVLLAEDDATFRGLIAQLLEDAGWEVVQAVDGVDLLERARHLSPAIVVTDNHMPRMNGIDALSRLRSEDVRCPALLVTSFADTDLRRAAHSLECRLLDKPVDIGMLLAAIAELTR